MTEAPSRRYRAGWQALELDDFRGAETVARDALAANASDLEALQLLGDSLFYQQRFREALPPLGAVFDAAAPKGVGHRLGRCLLALGEFAQAESVLRRETANHPDLVNAFNALGIALVEQQRRAEALDAFRHAADLDPGSAEAHNNVGNVLMELGRYDAAIPHFRKVTERSPGLAEPHHNLGNALYIVKQYEEAAASYERALPARLTYTLSNLIRSELAMCRWRNLERNVNALRERLADPAAAEEPFVAACVLDSAREQLACAQGYARDKFPRLPAPMWREGARSRGRRLRVAYLSADFHAHATTYLIAGLLERHDREKFEVSAVSFGPDDKSDSRARVAAAVDRFVDVRAHTDQRAARIVREMEIDIAIDLKGYTGDARPGILAHRPAPVQIAYLGFPGTSGASFIDYLVADRFLVPETDEASYSEKVIVLPDTYQVNDDRRPLPAAATTRTREGLPETGFVFCSFNNNFKIMPAVFDAWMRLLARVPGSVLWLLGDSPSSMQNLTAEARARGVDPRRLVFAPRVGHAEHLARQRLADLFLDTAPCNAHTTASDALWAGLPLLTCAGHTFASRVAGSLLHALGVPALVTGTLQEYEALAMRLATDGERLRGLREKIIEHRTTNALFDTDRFRRNIESAYQAAWEIWQSGQPPRQIVVGRPA
jgi:predicted O-linked N-acetylglucosamine transferase (SPINDLY family)